MFDYHMHTRVSFDSKADPADMLRAAAGMGLKEICFTDHKDYDPLGTMGCIAFDNNVYDQEYSGLSFPGLKIRRGMEYGMLPDNQAQFKADLAGRSYDFVLGSVHFVQDLDVYFAPFWEGKSLLQVEREYLEDMLKCVRAHDDFDVLAHLTYINKSPMNTSGKSMRYSDHADIIDEILKVLVQKGKGMEMNTSGVDRCSSYLPNRDIFLRFREFGGEIVTVGSDAHAPNRVGQYCRDACEILQDVFGYICTFENRKPVFHKL